MQTLPLTGKENESAPASQGALEIGRLLRASAVGFVVGCRVSQLAAPSLGALVRVPVEESYHIYGMIQEIHIDDDGLVRQLVTAERVDESIVADNRSNRNVPVEISVLSLGYWESGKIFHLLPPRPPLSLNTIYLCTPAELRDFISASGRFGYFRHILRSTEYPLAELLAAHLRQAYAAQKGFNPAWINEAARELIVLLRDDYATLISVLSALGDALPEVWRDEAIVGTR